MIVLKKLLLEHPDNISYRGNNYDYSDGIAVFSVFRNQNTKKWVGVTLIETENERLVIKTTDDEVNKSLQYFNDKNYSDYAIHPHIMSSLSISGLIRRVDSAYAYRNARPDIPVNGRVWYVNDKSLVNGKRYLISFWNGVEHFNNFDREIEGCLELAGVEDINQCLFEFIDRKNQWLTYSEVTGKEDIDTAKDDEETIKQLLKIQHINPKAKSVIRSLQGSPTNKLQKAADKLGMSTIQLKQLLGRDIAENQLQEKVKLLMAKYPAKY